MNLKIEQRAKNKIIGSVVKRKVKKLVRVIPKEHLIGLDKIVILDEIEDKGKRGIGGIYRQKHNNQPCSIELSINTIYKSMPKILFFFPFVASFSLADVLYHEVGHHYHKKFTHGVNKKSEEKFAEKYSAKMVKKGFRWWAPFFIPLAPLIRYLNKKVNK